MTFLKKVAPIVFHGGLIMAPLVVVDIWSAQQGILQKLENIIWVLRGKVGNKSGDSGSEDSESDNQIVVKRRSTRCGRK